MYLMPEQLPTRKIRSFIRRQGRITQGQEFALEHHWDKYCLTPDNPLDTIQVFGRLAPLCVEIGFGNGDCLAQLAAANPDKDYLGIEVHRPGVGHLLMRLEEQGLHNVRVYCHDAIEILTNNVADNSLAAVHLFFPDPWHKRKHHKRRIVQSSFVELLALKLQSGGYFHAATDWEHYAKAMLEVLSADNRLTNASLTDTYCERPAYRPLTKFEQRGLRLGHGVWDLIFIKN
ncbi:tRNA (guanine-N(7)-)-methyltransferase TrmB [Methyloglobulus morosus KoM1]|uniref:tRNA (guanine-N(7)-)-methyltransferase n=2 Tax=Methyloglobulus TaxID=1410680 RepID=V5E1L2_9GAMM|nr:tRNA (guanosine(46)-N7)-methyltransferase TrmB [Methyloglobulus morosus]ESS73446.1 tRNA (guanine-N(7)-)-methyltransferase TrmB [Methyloglobulus morosus KoM1]